jgi:ABC-type glutathione transport system ATPase component
MTITPETIQFCIHSLAARTALKIAGETGCGKTDALRKLMRTKTYRLLLDADSYLHLETMEYIYDMYKAEITGDWLRWYEI